MNSNWNFYRSSSHRWCRRLKLMTIGVDTPSQVEIFQNRTDMLMYKCVTCSEMGDSTQWWSLWGAEESETSLHPQFCLLRCVGGKVGRGGGVRVHIFGDCSVLEVSRDGKQSTILGIVVCVWGNWDIIGPNSWDCDVWNVNWDGKEYIILVIVVCIEKWQSVRVHNFGDCGGVWGNRGARQFTSLGIAHTQIDLGVLRKVWRVTGPNSRDWGVWEVSLV